MSDSVPDRRLFALTLANRGYKIGVEVGVERGIHAKILCSRIPNLKLYCVDSWSSEHRPDIAQERLDGFFEEAMRRLAGFDVELIRASSLEAAKRFKDGSMDFVYLDGDHTLDGVAADIAAWQPKIRPGGLLCGHDYDLVADALPDGFEVYGKPGTARTWAIECPT